MFVKPCRWLGLILIYSLSACIAPPPLSPTPSPATSSTLTPTLLAPTELVPTETVLPPTPTKLSPTPRLSPTPTLAPTTTSTFGLSSAGPWLVYRDVAGWVAVDGADPHREPVELSREAPLSTTLTSAFTRAGALFAAPAPSDGWFAFYSANSTANFALTVKRLPDRQSGLLQMPLLSADLEEQVRASSAGSLPDTVQAILFRRPLWSPDGRALAFAGAFETSNSALYLYRLGEKVAKRLTDGEQQAVLVAWSPDSQWLLYEILSPDYAGQAPVVASIWAIPAAGGAPKKLLEVANESTDAPEFLGWSPMGEAVMFMPDVDGGDNAVCVALNLITGQTATWQRGDFSNMAYDPQTGTVAMIPISIYGPDSIVLAYPDGKKIQPPVLSGKIWPSIEWLPGLQRFFAYGVYETILLAPDGSLVYLPDETAQQIDERPAVSPDGQWLAFWNENSGVRLYDSSGKPVRAISVDDAQGTLAVAWQPDSSGFYMVGDDGKLYSVTLPEGEPELVDSGLDSSVNNMLPDAPANLGWVQAGSKP